MLSSLKRSYEKLGCVETCVFRTAIIIQAPVYIDRPRVASAGSAGAIWHGNGIGGVHLQSPNKKKKTIAMEGQEKKKINHEGSFGGLVV